MNESEERESPLDLQEEAHEHRVALPEENVQEDEEPPEQQSLKLATLEAENADLREKYAGLQGENADLREENDDLRYQLGLLRTEARMVVRADDFNEVSNGRPPLTVCYAQNGHAMALAQRLRVGADPNQVDENDNPCIMIASLFGKPEGTRLLIAAGAYVSFIHPMLGNLLNMVAAALGRDTEPFHKGDFVLTADLLIDAGAPVPVRIPEGRSVIAVLNEKQNKYDAPGEDASKAEDCRALISLYTGEYWRKYEGRNPFLHCSTADEATWHLMAGAANTGENGHVEMTRLRSIRPSLRQDVMTVVDEILATQSVIIQILWTVAREPGSQSPFGVFSGRESLLQEIADYLGVRGRMLRNVREAKAAFDELLSGEVESEYEPGQWVHETDGRERNVSRRNAPE